MPRIFVDTPLHPGNMDLPDRAVRHVQVLRMQPGESLTLFDGQGGEWSAVITDMRKRVAVEVQMHRAVEREAPQRIKLAIGMPANERMDWLVEKATELGVSEIEPLATERSVLRLAGERAEKKLAHWQSVAIAACEQCGRNRVPQIQPIQGLQAYLAAIKISSANAKSFVLSLQSNAISLQQLRNLHPASEMNEMTFLSGPEGGLSSAEEAAAIEAGFVTLSLGPRVLRAETAPLVILSMLNTA